MAKKSDAYLTCSEAEVEAAIDRLLRKGTIVERNGRLYLPQDAPPEGAKAKSGGGPEEAL